MWKRRELKRRARRALKSNYWRCVLAALVLAMFCGGSIGLSGCIGASCGSAAAGLTAVPGQVDVPAPTESTDLLTGGNTLISPADNSLISPAGKTAEDAAPADAADVEFTGNPDLDEAINEMMANPQLSGLAEALSDLDQNVFLIIGIIVLGVLALIMLVSLLVHIFIINPLSVGCHYFFAHNSEEKAPLGDLAAGFDHGFGRVAKGMFLTDLFLFFWTLLFIIPGIIKSYSYRMVPYILADQPELGALAAIKRSRQMMKGNKWRAFVLDLSFILWYLLSFLTLGIVHFFYVRPYVQATNGELYQALKAGNGPDADPFYDSEPETYDDPTPDAAPAPYAEPAPSDAPASYAEPAPYSEPAPSSEPAPYSEAAPYADPWASSAADPAPDTFEGSPEE